MKRKALESGAFDAVICSHWAKGGAGAADLAMAVEKASNAPSNFKFLYDLDVSICVSRCHNYVDCRLFNLLTHPNTIIDIPSWELLQAAKLSSNNLFLIVAFT